MSEHLRASGRFGLDTEFVAEETYEPVLCLIQVATAERLAVIDAMAFQDLSPFWDVALDPNVEVVLHAAGEDLRICRIKTLRLPERIFDVQLAAGFAGMSYPLSLNNLTQATLGVSLVGGESRTDWRKRPLSNAQMNYALEDVRHLLDMADALKARLREMGRLEWVEEETRTFLAEIEEQQREERWRRLPGIQGLNRRGLEVARRLSDWRAADAAGANRPLRYVMRDDLLVAIAKRQPRSPKDLEALRDFNRAHLIRRSREIVDVVNEAMEVPEEDLPRHAERPEDMPGVSMVVNLMQAALARCSIRHRIATSLTGTSQDLRELTRWHLEGRPEHRTPALMRGWRRKVCGEELLGVLEGRVALRVNAGGPDVPVELIELPDWAGPGADAGSNGEVRDIGADAGSESRGEG